MPFLWKKEKTIIQKIIRYFHQIGIAAEQFTSCMDHLIKNPPEKRDHNLVEEVHKCESLADDYRREIEFEMYNKALIPEIRGDILGIIETLDRIPNSFQSVTYQVSLQLIEFPPVLHADFSELIAINIQAYELVREALDGFFFKKNILSLFTAIDEVESRSDKIERSIIKKIFELKIEKADKILLKEIVINIGNISDFAESVSDRLNLTIIKRRI